MKTIIKYSFLLASIVAGTANVATAQQPDTKLKQEVEVTKAYQPSVSDAFKINDIPKIEEEATEKPVFEYSISSEPVFSTFSVKPVQAATMVGEPKTVLSRASKQSSRWLHYTFLQLSTPFRRSFHFLSPA